MKIPAKMIVSTGGLRAKKVKVKVDNKVVFYDPTERVVTKTKLSFKQLYVLEIAKKDTSKRAAFIKKDMYRL